VFLLALVWHLGARSAVAQVGGDTITAAVTGQAGTFAFTADGDVYYSENPHGSNFAYERNVFGGPTPTAPHSFGQVRTKYLGRTPGASRLDAQHARNGH